MRRLVGAVRVEAGVFVAEDGDGDEVERVVRCLGGEGRERNRVDLALAEGSPTERRGEREGSDDQRLDLVLVLLDDGLERVGPLGDRRASGDGSRVLE